MRYVCLWDKVLSHYCVLVFSLGEWEHGEKDGVKTLRSAPALTE